MEVIEMPDELSELKRLLESIATQTCDELDSGYIDHLVNIEDYEEGKHVGEIMMARELLSLMEKWSYK